MVPLMLFRVCLPRGAGAGCNYCVFPFVSCRDGFNLSIMQEIQAQPILGLTCVVSSVPYMLPRGALFHMLTVGAFKVEPGPQVFD